ncbi:MAG: cation:proton antiporter [Candidatus Micrarchaeia archaeon]
MTLLFLVFAGIVFLGYILNALFSRIKIASILPLMLIGLLIGPVLHTINTSQNSIVSMISPYVTAIAIAFVLFEVGLNINIFTLGKVIARITKFTFALSVTTGIVLGIAIWLMLHWSIVIAFIAGFALSGPSSIILPTLVRISKINKKLKAALIFESVATDSLELIIPIILFYMLQAGSLEVSTGAQMLFDFIVGSTLFGIGFAFFWVFILKQFSYYSKEYSWMLTMTMVIATYGLAQAIGFNGAMAIFTFGIFLANIPKLSKFFEKYTYDIKKEFVHIREYQKEITFFVSTFFFVYIGLLFSISNATLVLLLVGLVLALFIWVLRILFVPMLNKLFNARNFKSERTLASYDVARGLSPTIVATMPVALGLVIPGFLDMIFIVVLITNVITTFGMFMYARRFETEVKNRGKKRSKRLKR